ncbi:crotonobetainyl-CoA--carnitine CoA-transferase [Brachybacterium timonense]|uniref:crotonobetainyl-CoA--carnitine CoA-transferase n=1 Tax=Brachybacterium timonense TaxID=2050896 RepID=UPI00110D8879|nr:crotonobetainyl-CoA--carnitine CoA-transferase [Brachybacterium timonense]
MPAGLRAPRTWRRRAEAAVAAAAWRSSVAAALGIEGLPARHTLRADTTAWTLRPRPQQGRWGNCWVMAPMLALHEVAPERIAAMLTTAAGDAVLVQLPGVPEQIRVARSFPRDATGRLIGARQESGPPGWPAVLEAAIADHVAGGYRMLQRGFARFGFGILVGRASRTLLRLPTPEQVQTWASQHRAMTASTHPASTFLAHGWMDNGARRVLAANHVYALVGADPHADVFLLRNPVRPGEVLSVARTAFRRGVLSVDVTEPLRS